MAQTGADWVSIFSQYNRCGGPRARARVHPESGRRGAASGTYNNEWIVVDNKKVCRAALARTLTSSGAIIAHATVSQFTPATATAPAVLADGLLYVADQVPPAARPVLPARPPARPPARANSITHSLTAMGVRRSLATS